MVVDTYRSALGRDPLPHELYYWSLYPDTPPGLINGTSLFAVLLQTLANSPAERASTAERALSAAFQQEEASNPRLRAYLDDGRNPPLRRAIAELMRRREGGGFRGLVAWLSRPEVRRSFTEDTGMASLVANTPKRP